MKTDYHLLAGLHFCALSGGVLCQICRTEQKQSRSSSQKLRPKCSRRLGSAAWAYGSYTIAFSSRTNSWAASRGVAQDVTKRMAVCVSSVFFSALAPYSLISFSARLSSTMGKSWFEAEEDKKGICQSSNPFLMICASSLAWAAIS